MTYEWDETKRQSNLNRHNLDFKNIGEFDWDTAVVEIDRRREYGELRLVAYGLQRDRLTVLVFTHRGENVRVISWRKANDREKRAYDGKI